MSKQLLIYESAVPITLSAHAKTFFESTGDYAFSQEINAVPLTVGEIFEASSEYAIVFVEIGKEVMPAAVLGVQPEQNLYLSKDNHWNAKYIPAFIRRYPFVFAATEEGSTLTLCLDETHPGVNQDGRGEPFFSRDGQPSEYIEGVLKFLKAYQAQFQYTKEFCAKIKQLNLLEPLQAEVKKPSGEKVLLGDFQGVTRQRLHTLSADSLQDLVKRDELELIYLHLHSLKNFDVVRDRFLENPQVVSGA